jgi:phage repressor protein C with HTH and peptisase S24 domain
MNGGRGRSAVLLGVSDNTIDNYRHGVRELKHTTLLKLAEHAGLPQACLNYEWLFEETELTFRDQEGNVFEEIPEAAAGKPKLEDAPRFEPRHDQATRPPGFSEEPRRRQVVMPDTFWDRLEVDPENVKVVLASGDSMAPTVVDGAPVFIDTSDRGLNDGRIYVFEFDGEVMIRRVQRLADGDIELLCDNGRLYPAQRIEKFRIVEIRVVGRVLSSSSIT